MYPILIITVIIASVILVLVGFERIDQAYLALGAIIVVIGGLTSVLPSEISMFDVPKEYEMVENYTYKTENGNCETIDGIFYKKDGVYYENKLKEGSNWHIFEDLSELVEVELPQSAEPIIEVIPEACILN